MTPHSVNLSGVFFGLLLSGLSAWRGYAAAQRAELANGRPPFGWEPLTWSIICWPTLVLGRLLLFLGAARDAGRQVVSAPSWTPPEEHPVFGGWEPPAAPAQETWAHQAAPVQQAWAHQAAPAAVIEPQSPAEPEPVEVEAPVAPLPSVPPLPQAMDILPRW